MNWVMVTPMVVRRVEVAMSAAETSATVIAMVGMEQEATEAVEVLRAVANSVVCAMAVMAAATVPMGIRGDLILVAKVFIQVDTPKREMKVMYKDMKAILKDQAIMLRAGI